MPDGGLAPLVADLVAEQEAIVAVLRPCDRDDWLRPTPAWHWDVRDTVAHLAHTDEMAVATMAGTDGAINEVADRSASGADVTFVGVLRGRRRTGAEVLAWWEAAAGAQRAALLALSPADRVPWGLGMQARSFVTARLMETWAHGLDVHAALGVEPVDTDRLAHVAWIATRALPYAFSVAGLDLPTRALRVDLELPSGARWTSGPEDAPDRISGPASQYCRRFVQRLDRSATHLTAEGDGAHLALEVARAYL